MGKWLTYNSMSEIREDFRLDMQEVDLYEEIFRRYGAFTIYPGNNVYADIPLEQSGEVKILWVLFHIHSKDDSR